MTVVKIVEIAHLRGKWLRVEKKPFFIVFFFTVYYKFVCVILLAAIFIGDKTTWKTSAIHATTILAKNIVDSVCVNTKTYPLQ
jgi:hypothetical protein